MRVRHDLSILDSLEPLIKEVEAELVRQSNVEPWAEQAAFLVQQPGIGVHNAMLLLAAIGDIRRFDAAHKLVGYAGLGARVRSSAEEQYGGRITKQGRRDLRSTMVEACLGGGWQSPVLERIIRAAGGASRQAEGHRRSRAQDAGGGLARADQARRRSSGRSGEGGGQVPRVVMEAGLSIAVVWTPEPSSVASCVDFSWATTSRHLSRKTDLSRSTGRGG
jgi:hypothetical protein